MDSERMFEIGTRILEDRLTEADFDNVFILFEQVCNTNDILTFTLKGYSESFQFIFDEYAYGIMFQNGICKMAKGEISLPDVTFWIHKEVALDILNGRVYSAVAHMNGDVDYTGYKDGAIRFAGILECVLDEITEYAEGRREDACAK